MQVIDFASKEHMTKEDRESGAAMLRDLADKVNDGKVSSFITAIVIPPEWAYQMVGAEDEPEQLAWILERILRRLHESCDEEETKEL